MTLRVLILGVNGFIGHHLSRRILDTTPWHVHGLDTRADRVGALCAHPRFHFVQGDITTDQAWIDAQVQACDVVLPLVAIATPMAYVKTPLQMFTLDFEANLPIVRQAVRHRRRVVFPSTSEVYGMSADPLLDPATTNLVLGPIHKTRWIYACAKQMMDRVIRAHGQQDGLDFTLFRPFNWIGPGLDSIHTPLEGSARVVSQFLGNIARGEDIMLVDGGVSRRAFTHVSDGVDALMSILHNPGGVASGQIYNIGHPGNDLSVRSLAEMMLSVAAEFPEYSRAPQVRLVPVSAQDYYGAGYQDTPQRVPDIRNTCRDLGWAPRVTLRSALRQVFEAYRHDVQGAGCLAT